MVVAERGQDDYVMGVAKLGGDAGVALKHVKEAPELAEQVPVESLATLSKMELSGVITASQAKTIVAVMIESQNADPEVIAADLGFEAMDNSDLEAMVDQAIAGQPEAWEKFCAGEGKAMGALVGAVMKASQGQADGKAVTALFQTKKP
jgi:aspartyl-tRNA(Asn)/glutamyl-tRNA(Gln) amidotransferase subunit B